MDKVIGRALLDGLVPLGDRILCVSGRLSFELVQKAAVAGAPILVGVGAPSSLAIELADDRGLTLCGFARGRGVNVYTHPERITGLALGRAQARPGARARPPRSTRRPRRGRCRDAGIVADDEPLLARAARPPPRRSAAFHATSVERPRGPTSSPRSASRSGERRGERCAPARAPTPSRHPRTLAATRPPRRCAARTGSRGRAASAPSAGASSSACSPVGERAVAGPRNEQLIDAVRPHVQAAAALRAAQPLLPGGGVEVAAERGDVDRDRADRLGGVEQHRDAGGAQRGDVHHAAAHPRDVRAGDQPRGRASPRREARRTAQRGRDAVAPTRPPEWRQQAGMLLVGRDHLVAGSESRPAITVLTPSVVEPVSATSHGSHPSTRGVAGAQRPRPAPSRCRSTVARSGPARALEIDPLVRGLGRGAAAPGPRCRRSGRRAARGPGTASGTRPDRSSLHC